MEGKKQIIIYIISIAFVIILISSIVVYANSQNDEVTLEEKVSIEIDYLSSKLIGTLNQFNGFSFIGYDIQSKEEQNQTATSKQTDTNAQKNSEITDESNASANNSSDNNKNQILAFKGNYPTNWNTIEYQIEEIYHTWNTVVIDLHALNVNSDIILKFSDILNQATEQIKKKDKKEAMLQLTNLYALLPEYAKSYQSDPQWANLLQIKSNIIASYSFASNEQWNEAKTKVQEATKLFTERLNSVSNQNQNQATSNKVYILIHELDNAINLKDKEIFFIQYSSMIEKIELL